MKSAPIPLAIRPFRPDEAQALAALRLEALRDLPMAFAEHADSPAEDFGYALSRGCVWGAFDDERPVAMAGLERRPGRNVRHRATIWGVYVGPTARGRRCGQALLRAIIDDGARAGVQIFDLAVGDFNDPALALYRSLGFEPSGYFRNAVKIGDDYTHELVMTLHVENPRSLTPEPTP